MIASMKTQVFPIARKGLALLVVVFCLSFSLPASLPLGGDASSSAFCARVWPANGLEGLGIRIVNRSIDGQSATIIAEERWGNELTARGYRLEIIKWYGARSPALRHETKGSTLANESVSLSVAPNGAFTMQRSSDSKWLLFPNPSTSALSVRVDENVYWTRDNSLTVTTPLTIANSTTAFIEFTTPENIVVRETFKLAGDAVEFTVEATNASTSNHRVQVRYLFDTQVDVNDGSPLYAQGVTDSRGSTICTYETDIPNILFRNWQGYDVWPNPGLMSVGTICSVPCRMVFAWWPMAIDFAWDYTPNPNQRFYTPGYTSSPESDSCVLMYFDLGVLAPRTSKSVSTLYGLGTGSRDNPLEDFSSAISELRSRYMRWAERKVEIAADTFAKGIVALRKGETEKKIRAGIGLAVFFASVWMAPADSVSLVTRLKQAGFELSPCATAMVEGLEIGKAILDLADLGANIKDLLSPRSMAECHLNWVEEHQRELLSIWTYEEISREYKRFLWEELVWRVELLPPGGVPSSGFKTLCETICDTALSSLQKSVTSNNGMDYPISTAAAKLRSIRDSFRSERNLVVWMDDSGEVVELSNESEWVAALDHAVASFQAAQRTAWISTAVSVIMGGAKIGLAFVTAGWAAVAEVLVSSVDLVNSVINWTVINSQLGNTEEQLGAQVGFAASVAESQVRNGGKVLVLASKYLDYMNRGSLKRGIDVDNTKVSLKSCSIPDKQLVLESHYIVSGRDIVEIQNDAANQVPIQAYIPIYAKHPDGRWTLVNYGITDVENAPGGATYSPNVREIRLPPQETLNAEKYLAFVYLGCGPAIKSRIVGPIFTSFTVMKDTRFWEYARSTVPVRMDNGVARTGSRDIFSFAPRGDTVVSDIVLEWGGSDLDLHVYDDLGRHVGVNYSTGAIETNIPGAIYSGPSARPEWIRLPNRVFSTCQLWVVGTETGEGGEPYSLLVFETPSRPALLSVSPRNITNSFDPSLTTSASIALRVSELGGQQMLENLSAQVTDLVSRDGVIPAEAVKIRFSSNGVSPGGTEVLNLIVDGIQQYQSGVYTGQVTVIASSGEPSNQAMLGGWRGTKGGTLEQVVDLTIEIKRAAIPVDVTSDVRMVFNSWALDRATGALIVSITLSNTSGMSGLPLQLEKVFWYAITETTNVRLATVSGYTNGMAFYDVTDQIEAQLPNIGNGDLRLDPGESVTFTVLIYSRDRSIPASHIFSVWAAPVCKAAVSPPRLTVLRLDGRMLTLSWPVSAMEFAVEETDSLVQPSWRALSATPVIQGQQNTVTVPISSGTKFYRLRQK